jgi:type I restriction enzyme, S subunit
LQAHAFAAWQQIDGHICSTGFAVLRSGKNINPRFLYHLIFSEGIAEQIRQHEVGSNYPAINESDVRELSISLPPTVDEQEKIASILDTIDSFIALTEIHIAKLKQAKAGLLHDLLTRGIDEHGELRDPIQHPEQFKDSPLGRIPVSWNCQSLGAVLNNIDAGKSPSCPDRPAMSGEWGVLKVSAVHPEGFRANENKVITNPAYIKAEYQVDDCDLLITRANTSELVGLACLVNAPPPNLLISDKTLRLNVNTDKASKALLNYVLQMPYVRSQIENNATGSSAGMKNISQGDIRNLFIMFPVKMREQNEIVRAMDCYVDRIKVKEKLSRKLELLKKGLMSDLLTGRVRVKVDS